MKKIDLIYARHNRTGVAGEIPPKQISYHELTIVLKGSMLYRVNGESIVLNSADAVFMPEGTYRYRADSEEQADYVSFNFLSDEVPQLPTVMRGCVNREVQLLIGAFDEFSAKEHLDSREKTAWLIGCLLLILQDKVKAAQLDPLAIQIVHYLHSNYAQRITLSEIGRLTAFSGVYCDTVFRREMGRSIIDYLIDLRIDEAKKLLIENRLSVGQIGEMTGFRDANYFSRVFKKRTGDTPSGYRKRLYGQ